MGFVFDLRSEPSPMGKHLGRYRLVAMSIAPEGYYAVVGYEDDWSPANNRPVPEVALAFGAGVMVDCCSGSDRLKAFRTGAADTGRRTSQPAAFSMRKAPTFPPGPRSNQR